MRVGHGRSIYRNHVPEKVLCLKEKGAWNGRFLKASSGSGLLTFGRWPLVVGLRLWCTFCAIGIPFYPESFVESQTRVGCNAHHPFWRRGCTASLCSNRERKEKMSHTLHSVLWIQHLHFAFGKYVVSLLHNQQKCQMRYSWPGHLGATVFRRISWLASVVPSLSSRLIRKRDWIRIDESEWK